MTSGAEGGWQSTLPALAGPERDKLGRFLSGEKRTAGPGRPKGSRNKLTEAVTKLVGEDFEAHGKATLDRIRESDPVEWWRIVMHMMNRPTPIDFSQMDYEEIGQYMHDERTNANFHKLIERFWRDNPVGI